MKKVKLKDVSVDELVEHFTSISLEQDRAMRVNDIRRVNRLFDDK